MEKKLEVKHLRISFRTPGGKVQAVRDISFDLNKGETLAIVGESGSGKSVTNRAIIGISAGNAIVESGEILYDGKDLLRISEEDFHKIRGDKIAMIFQDPMSSLNPIMRIGKQITETMIVKGRAAQKSARNTFNSLLKLLNKKMNEIHPENASMNDQNCKTFDSFCINSTKLEGARNFKLSVLTNIKEAVDQAIFMLSNKQKYDWTKAAHLFLTRIEYAYDPRIISEEADIIGVANELTNKHLEVSSAIDKLNVLASYLQKGLDSESPNYFTLGYYLLRNPQADVTSMSVTDLTKMTRAYIDSEYMINFINCGAEALKHNYLQSLTAKEALIGEIKDVISYVESCDVMDKNVIYPMVNGLCASASKAINKLDIVKNSTEYTFKSSALYSLNSYFGALKSNPKEQARFDKQQARWDALKEKGKTPDWKVAPAAIIDTNGLKNTFVHTLGHLMHNYERQIAARDTFHEEEVMVSLIDYLKEQASAVVYKETRTTAKQKALKLLEEVGISQPRQRYKQYPFEFSGGMRQRIVIAIALALNPDILICDEPTTALDVTIQSQILELINKLKEERHLSVIFITHDLGVVANMADRIAVMYAGKIVEMGTSEEVFYDPRHPYTWALLSSMPDLDTKEKLEAIPGTPPNMIYPPVGDAFAARNKYAMAIDFELQPPLFKVSETHSAATWLLHPDAPKVEMPRIITERIKRMRQEGGKTNE